MRSFFGPGGLLSRAHPHYEHRTGQLEMAQGVEAAFRERRHFVVEAGTGTGKTLAYLLPALLSGKRVVVSTGTKNLQEQLFYKDVPFLTKILAQQGIPDVRVSYMKGRSNYLCRQKLYDFDAHPALSISEDFDAGPLPMLREWEKTTETGDRAELTGLPESGPAAALWRRLDARREACTGQRCAQFDRCFITQMHRKALESDLVIVNHHLLFADLALKQTEIPGLGVLPDYNAAIFDEAHEIEDTAGQYFGVALSNFQVEDLARDCETVEMKGNGTPELHGAIRRLGRNAEIFFASLPSTDGRQGFSERERYLEEHRESYLGLLSALGGIRSALEMLPERSEDVHRYIGRALELAGELEFLVDPEAGETDNFVFWIERRGRGTTLQATPIDVSSLLESRLFDRVETVVLTSATLAVSGTMEFVRRRLGLRYARERVLDSHFDYPTQALLYLPNELPDPRSSGFVDDAADEVVRLLKATHGRAFVLFTSYAQMNQVYERVRGRVKFPMMMQGTAPRTALLDRFRSEKGSVLFATASFWQGVDVPGEQLSCVIIDRLPFAVPTDPVVVARSRRIEEDGGNAFFDYQVPAAVLALKQGFGRLIRSRTDRGVLALLDSRIRTKNYGGLFLESLPGYRTTSDFAEVEKFMGKGLHV